jgi:hypothetical protein
MFARAVTPTCAQKAAWGTRRHQTRNGDLVNGDQFGSTTHARSLSGYNQKRRSQAVRGNAQGVQEDRGRGAAQTVHGSTRRGKGVSSREGVGRREQIAEYAVDQKQLRLQNFEP